MDHLDGEDEFNKIQLKAKDEQKERLVEEIFPLVGSREKNDFVSWQNRFFLSLETLLKKPLYFIFLMETITLTRT
ncbi:hypothetical protein GCM10020331_021840 [Ectobacillus funiculus]